MGVLLALTYPSLVAVSAVCVLLLVAALRVLRVVLALDRGSAEVVAVAYTVARMLRASRRLLVLSTLACSLFAAALFALLLVPSPVLPAAAAAVDTPAPSRAPLLRSAAGDGDAAPSEAAYVTGAAVALAYLWSLWWSLVAALSIDTVLSRCVGRVVAAQGRTETSGTFVARQVSLSAALLGTTQLQMCFVGVAVAAIALHDAYGVGAALMVLFGGVAGAVCGALVCSVPPGGVERAAVAAAISASQPRPPSMIVNQSLIAPPLALPQIIRLAGGLSARSAGNAVQCAAVMLCGQCAALGAAMLQFTRVDDHGLAQFAIVLPTGVACAVMLCALVIRQAPAPGLLMAVNADVLARFDQPLTLLRRHVVLAFVFGAAVALGLLGWAAYASTFWYAIVGSGAAGVLAALLNFLGGARLRRLAMRRLVAKAFAEGTSQVLSLGHEQSALSTFLHGAIACVAIAVCYGLGLSLTELHSSYIAVAITMSTGALTAASLAVLAQFYGPMAALSDLCTVTVQCAGTSDVHLLVTNRLNAAATTFGLGAQALVLYATWAVAAALLCVADGLVAVLWPDLLQFTGLGVLGTLPFGFLGAASISLVSYIVLRAAVRPQSLCACRVASLVSLCHVRCSLRCRQREVGDELDDISLSLIPAQVTDVARRLFVRVARPTLATALVALPALAAGMPVATRFVAQLLPGLTHMFWGVDAALAIAYGALISGFVLSFHFATTRGILLPIRSTRASSGVRPVARATEETELDWSGIKHGSRASTTVMTSAAQLCGLWMCVLVCLVLPITANSTL